MISDDVDLVDITAEGSEGVDLGAVRPGEDWTVVNATADTLRLAREVSNAKSPSHAAAPALRLSTPSRLSSRS